MRELISIIVPFYNVEDYLEECLDSICNQSYKDLEILLIDNQSTDTSVDIACKYANMDRRIRVYRTINAGVSAARNMGLAKATGKYIGFVDSDDVVSNEYISKMYTLINEYNAQIAQCNFVRGIDSSILERQTKKQKGENINIECFNGLEMQFQLFNSKKEMGAVVLWNKLYDREVLQGIIFPEGKVHEDDAVIYKIYNNAEKIVVTDEKEYFYRTRKGSIVTGTETKKVFDKKENYKEKLNFYLDIKNQKLYDLTLKRYCYSLKNCICLKPGDAAYKDELKKCKRKVLESRYIGLKEKLGILFL